MWTPALQAQEKAPVVVFTKDKAPPTPKLEDPPLKESVWQYGQFTDDFGPLAEHVYEWKH